MPDKTDPWAKMILAFREEIATSRDTSTFLGTPPMVDARGGCTFCGQSYTRHGDGDFHARWAFDSSRVLREHHRRDFGPHGYYADEPNLEI